MILRASVLRRLLWFAALMGPLCCARIVRAQDVSLELRTKDARREYSIGEPIPIQLVFSSNSRQYVVESSFRFPDFSPAGDEFLVTPSEGVTDPMEDYRQAIARSSPQLGFYGGLTGSARLGDKPEVLDLVLTREVRFSQPGRYVVSVRDRRVSLVRTSPNDPFRQIELTSKPLTLTIVAANPEWQQQQLAAALTALKQRPGINAEACEKLGTLATREAEVAMADALEDEDLAIGCSFSYVLLGAKNRKAVLEHMQNELENPKASITPYFVETMVTLATLEEGGDGDFYLRQAENRMGVYDTLLALVDEKKGAARSSAISTLVNSLLNTPSDSSPQKTQVLRLASEIFERLNSQAQTTLLSTYWKDFASDPSTAGVLRRCAEAPSTSCGQIQGDLLLKRLNELSPADAQEVILADIRSENPHFPPGALAMLPDKELPELDPLLGQRLQSSETNIDATAELIQRYATGALLGAVESYLDEKGVDQLGGEVEPNLIAYLLRVHPDAGAQKLRAALAKRNGTGWYKYLLENVALRTPSASIQPIAIESLSDSDHDVARSAVLALERVGDETGKAALLARLAEWHGKWTGREREMFWNPGDEPFADDRMLGDELMHAIATGAGWLLTPSDQQQLVQLAITENQRQQVRQFVDAAEARPVPITLIDTGSINIQIIIAQYSYENQVAAERKLSQFPAGTAFALRPTPANAELQATIAAVESFLTQRGSRLQMEESQP
jgi:hypothetical protein